MTSSVIHLMAGVSAAKTPPVVGLSYIASVSASLSSGLFVSGGFASTEITWSSNPVDDGWGFTPPSTDFVVPSGVTLAQVTGSVYASAGTGGFDDGLLRILLNGAAVTEEYHDDQFRNLNQTAVMLSVSPGDIISLEIAPQFGMTLTAPETRMSIIGYGP